MIAMINLTTALYCFITIIMTKDAGELVAEIQVVLKKQRQIQD